MDNVYIALISSIVPIIVIAINIAYNVWRESKLIQEKRDERFFERKIEAVDQIMQSMIPAFIHCVEPKNPIEFLASLNKLKSDVQNSMFKNSVWLLPDSYEPVNRFLKEVIKCIDLFCGELGNLATKDITKFTDEDINIFVSVYENLGNTIINKLLDERLLLFSQLHIAFSIPAKSSAKKLWKNLSKKIKDKSSRSAESN